jgi:hypothetical protein
MVVYIIDVSPFLQISLPIECRIHYNNYKMQKITLWQEKMGTLVCFYPVCVEEQHSKQQTQYNFKKRKCHASHDSKVKRKTFLLLQWLRRYQLLHHLKL